MDSIHHVFPESSNDPENLKKNALLEGLLFQNKLEMILISL